METKCKPLTGKNSGSMVCKNVQKSTAILVLFAAILLGCSKDPDENAGQNGNFSYTVSGAVSKTISGDDASFGFVEGGALLDKTFIRLVVGSDELNTIVFSGPIEPGTYLVNPQTIKDANGNIVFLDVKESDSSADFATGSSFTNDLRSFSTHSADGGNIKITTVGANSIEGNFNMSLMELAGGDPFNNPKISVQGTFKAVKK